MTIWSEIAARWLVLLLLAVAPLAAAQQRFRAGVDVLHIQISVADADGNFVPGLSVGDFLLRVGDEEREIVTAYAIDSDHPHESWLASTSDDEAVVVPTATVKDVDALPGAARRRFVLFIDLTSLSRSELHNMRRAAGLFVSEHVKPADLLAVVAYGTRRGLEYVVPFTTRHELVADAIAGFGLSRAAERADELGAGIPLDAIAALYGDVEGESVTDFILEVEESRLEAAVENLMDALRTLSSALLGTEGRKYVLMFSHGAPDAMLRDAGFAKAVERATAAARQADVVLYPFQPSNVGGGVNVHDVAEMTSRWQPGSSRGAFEAPATFQIRDRSVLHTLAKKTGGEAKFWRYAVKNGLEEVERITNDYYVLAFPLRDADGETIQVSVETRRPGVEVTWAPTELAVGARTEIPTEVVRHFEVAEALELSFNRNDLGATLRAWVLPEAEGEWARVAVAVQIDAPVLESLRDANPGGRAEFELLGLTLSAGSNVGDYFRGHARADLSRLPAATRLEPLRFASWLMVPPGRHYMKVLVREAASGRMFARSLAVTVPEEHETELRLDAPLLVLEPGVGSMLRGRPASAGRVAADDERRSDPLTVNGMPVTVDLADTVEAGTEVGLLVNVHGVAAHPETGEPRVALSASLEPGDGAGIPLSDISILRSEWISESRLLRVLMLVPIPADAPAGVHDLRLLAADAVTRTDAVSTLRLTVLGR